MTTRLIGTLLDGWDVRARNTAVNENNPIHTDSVAREYGFGGGLVPGVTTFAYLCGPLVAEYGQRFLEDAEVEVRLRRPLYDGQLLRAAARYLGDDDGAERWEAWVEAGGERVAEANVRVGALGALAPFTFTSGRALPDHPPVASPDTLPLGASLAAVRRRVELAEAVAYSTLVGDRSSLFGVDGGHLHPGWLLSRANRVLALNVELGPWMHTHSKVRLAGVGPAPTEVTISAGVVEVGTQRAGDYVVLDVQVADRDGRVLLRGLHRAVYRMSRRSV